MSGLIEDSTFVAYHCNWHEHTRTCTKNMPLSKRSIKVVDPNSTETTQQLLDPCRFNLPAKTHDKTHIDNNGNIVIARSHGYLNKFNPVISSALHCNNDIAFTGSSEKILNFIYYVTNYLTKCEATYEQYTIAIGAIKELTDKGNKDTLDQKIPMNKFIIKAYNRFTKTLEVGGPAVARYLKGHNSYYCSPTGKVTTLQVRWLVTYALHLAQDACSSRVQEQGNEERRDAFSEQYRTFRPGRTTTTIYQDYELRGPALRNLSLYEYCAQIEVKVVPKRGTQDRQYYQFSTDHPLFSTHVQTSVRDKSQLGTPVLQGSLVGPGASESDKYATVLTDEANHHMSMILLALFVPWEDITTAFRQFTSDITLIENAASSATQVWKHARQRCQHGKNGMRTTWSSSVALRNQQIVSVKNGVLNLTNTSKRHLLMNRTTLVP